jgi:hypothetical protein
MTRLTPLDPRLVTLSRVPITMDGESAMEVPKVQASWVRGEKRGTELKPHPIQCV